MLVLCVMTLLVQGNICNEFKDLYEENDCLNELKINLNEEKIDDNLSSNNFNDLSDNIYLTKKLNDDRCCRHSTNEKIISIEESMVNNNIEKTSFEVLIVQYLTSRNLINNDYLEKIKKYFNFLENDTDDLRRKYEKIVNPNFKGFKNSNLKLIFHDFSKSQFYREITKRYPIIKKINLQKLIEEFKVYLKYIYDYISINPKTVTEFMKYKKVMKIILNKENISFEDFYDLNIYAIENFINILFKAFNLLQDGNKNFKISLMDQLKMKNFFDNFFNEFISYIQDIFSDDKNLSIRTKYSFILSYLNEYLVSNEDFIKLFVSIINKLDFSKLLENDNKFLIDFIISDNFLFFNVVIGIQGYFDITQQGLFFDMETINYLCINYYYSLLMLTIDCHDQLFSSIRN